MRCATAQSCSSVWAVNRLDREALRFDPFRSGRGVRPVGFVHSMREGTYLASQAARADRSGSPG
jgi:hypothetical protein